MMIGLEDLIFMILNIYIIPKAVNFGINDRGFNALEAKMRLHNRTLIILESPFTSYSH